MKEIEQFMDFSDVLKSTYFTEVESTRLVNGHLPKDYANGISTDIGKIGIHYCENDEEYWVIGLDKLSPSFYSYSDALDYILKKLQ